MLFEGVFEGLAVLVKELVDAGVDGGCGGLGQGGEDVMVRDHVGEGAGVGAEDAVEAPLPHDDVAEGGVLGHGDVVPGVVGGHHGVGVAVLDGHAKGHGVVLVKEAGVEVGGGAVAVVLVGVGEEVLEEGGGFPGFGVGTLEAAGEGGGQGADEEGVFAVGLFGAAPAGIAGEVGVGSADDEATAVVLAEGVAGLVGLKGGGLLDEFGVPGLAEAASLRKGGGGDDGFAVVTFPVSGAPESETVEAFDVAGADDAEARDGGVGGEGVDLLFEGHAGEEVVDAGVGGEGGVLVGELLGGEGGGQEEQEGREEFHKWF